MPVAHDPGQLPCVSGLLPDLNKLEGRRDLRLILHVGERVGANFHGTVTWDRINLQAARNQFPPQTIVFLKVTAEICDRSLIGDEASRVVKHLHVHREIAHESVEVVRIERFKHGAV